VTRRLRVRTLRTRVSLLALAVITAWLLILATGLSFVLVSRLNRQVDDGLQVRAQAASATVVVRGGQPVGVGESATDSELDSSIWVYRTGTAISRPPVAAALQRVADELAGTPAHFVDRHGRRFYVLPLLTHGRQVGSIVAAADLDPYERTRYTALIGVGIVAVLMVAGAYPVLRFATGRALRPVGEMTRQAAEWGVVAPNERFGGDQRYVELASLAKSLDGLLGRLAAVLRHERHASAELSHELRTPLSRVAAQVELLMDSASPAQRQELQEIRANCAAMDGIIDTLLAAARSELTGVVGRASVDAVLRSFAAPTGRPRTVVESEPLLVGVDDDLIARMLAPVVDNARRYAAATITMTARQRGTVVEIDVANDGPRLPHDLAERVFEPGFSTREGGHDGVGLGLALARRLARSADGDLVVDGSSEQTIFRLTLPAG
jgi:signal transduction histidine kinase